MQVVQLTADPHENLRLDTEAPVHAPQDGEVLVNLLIRCPPTLAVACTMLCNCMWSWIRQAQTHSVLLPGLSTLWIPLG